MSLGERKKCMLSYPSELQLTPANREPTLSAVRFLYVVHSVPHGQTTTSFSTPTKPSPPPLRTAQSTMKPNPRPLSITSPGFSTLTADRPPLSKSASDSNLKCDSDGSGGDGGNHGTDLNREVAALSNKLISAINHQTKLDDSLSATKHELDLSKTQIRQLESETQRLLTRLSEESQQRGQAEKDKRHIELELENLTTALFDEANKVGCLIKC